MVTLQYKLTFEEKKEKLKEKWEEKRKDYLYSRGDK